MPWLLIVRFFRWRKLRDRIVGLVAGEIGLEGLVVVEQGVLLPLNTVDLAGLLGNIVICWHWRIDNRQVFKAES